MENGHISSSQDEDKALRMWFLNPPLSLEWIESVIAILGGLGYFIGCWMNEWNPKKKSFGVAGESVIQIWLSTLVPGKHEQKKG